jgi:viroplasmin and RNaseH domain-containing protein
MHNFCSALEARSIRRDNMTETGTDQYAIYVDGSFEHGTVSYGVVILKNSQFHTALFGIAKTELEHRQVGGEITAVAEALRWCQKHSVSAVPIYYDYEGLEAWATGRWHTEQPLTQKYAEFVRKSGVQIAWQKVTSHTGNLWNEKADQLAKQAIALRLTTQAVAPVSEQDALLHEAETLARAFADYLTAQGISAAFAGVFNDMYARVTALNGYFDLYNTRKKHLSPRIHNVKAEDRERLQAAWRAFRSSQG